MPKPDIHPTWYPDAKVICNGEVVMTTGSTQPEIHVDVWSDTHGKRREPGRQKKEENRRKE
jgi:large subunit ribosomal protein L31